MQEKFKTLAKSRSLPHLAAQHELALEVASWHVSEAELLDACNTLEKRNAGQPGEFNEASHRPDRGLLDRARADKALHESEEQLRAIFDNSLDAVVVVDDCRRILDANRSALEMFGRGKEELKGAELDDFMPIGREENLEAEWQEFLQSGEQRGECEILRASGTRRIVTYSSKANVLPGRHVSSLRDITQRKHAEHSLRELSHRLMRLQDEERRRIARELHDSTGQCLAALHMNLERVRRDAEHLGPKARQALEDGLRLSQQCSSDVRTISYLLHPPLLDEVGLAPALRWYADGFAERSGIRVALDIPDELNHLPKDVGTTLFRIIQESLTNIHRHSGSATARIRFAVNGGRIQLEVSDTGRGIEVETLRAGEEGVRGLGVGIAGMRERVRQLGGELEIEPGKPGTIVRAILPMEANNGTFAAAGGR